MLKNRQDQPTDIQRSDSAQVSEVKPFKQTSVKKNKNNGGESSPQGGLVCSKGLSHQAKNTAGGCAEQTHQQCLLAQLEQILRCIDGDTQSLYAQQSCGLCETSIAIELGYFSELAFKLKQLYAQERTYFQQREEVSHV